jgi:hypothetical protein
LTIAGCVAEPVSFDLAHLQAIPATTYTAFLECSGNSRSRFQAVEGTNWGEGAIGNATWTGALLRDVLTLAGPTDSAVDVVAQGADFEGMQRAIPMDLALTGDVLLAWAMNGEPLLPVHGAPVRLIVPGWGAIASTKWLTRLEVIDHEFDGYWNADNYVLYDETGAATGPVQRMPVKSLIVSPSAGASVDAGSVEVRGFAWSGHGGIESVEVSVDGGGWRPAEITAEDGPYAWVAFALEIDLAAGAHTLRSRARDIAGNDQPETAVWNRKGYQMNAILPVEIMVV